MCNLTFLFLWLYYCWQPLIKNNIFYLIEMYYLLNHFEKQAILHDSWYINPSLFRYYTWFPNFWYILIIYIFTYLLFLWTVDKIYLHFITLLYSLLFHKQWMNSNLTSFKGLRRKDPTRGKTLKQGRTIIKYGSKISE